MDHEWIWADFFVLARWSLRGRCVVFFHLAQRASIEDALWSTADLVVLLRKFEGRVSSLEERIGLDGSSLELDAFLNDDLWKFVPPRAASQH